MSSNTQDTLTDDDVFNYINPKYSERVVIERQSALLASKENALWAGSLWGDYELHHVAGYNIKNEMARPRLMWQKKLLAREGPWAVIFGKHRSKIHDSIELSAELAAILLEITNLAFEEEEDQFGLIRPSYDAFRNCMKLVLELAENGQLFKPSDISVDHNGDIRISWAGGGRQAELVCPSQGEPYVYYSSGETFGIPDGELTIDVIIEKVRWAMDGK